MTEGGDISKLAEILRQNGDMVLNASSKLSLNATLLQKINKEFDSYFGYHCERESRNFSVLANSSTSSQIVQDLHFLYDFMQKVVGLKITNNANLMLLDNKVDISIFKSIKYLELRKVPVRELIGWSVVQPQLESIVCVRCLPKVEELLSDCAGDEASFFMWGELREAVFTYNDIEVLDTAVAFAPWLEVLDLSHNKLVDVRAIECLPSLKYVNLSYNCLTTVPTFNKSARKKMEVLVMKNNYIESLSGLAGLDHLTELDVSWNWISNYECLQPFLTMSALQNLSLLSNPIAYNKHYRKLVVGFLHINASFSEFVLDGLKLSKYEKSIVGYKLCQPIRSVSSSTVASGSVRSGSPSSQYQNPEASTSDRGSAAKKSGKVRLAMIPNLDDGTFEEIRGGINSINLNDPGPTDHLVTKKKIEDARATYGSDNWLRCEAGSVVQDILGLPPSGMFSSTPIDYYYLEAALKPARNVTVTQAVIENHPDNYPSSYYSLVSQNTPGKSGEEKQDGRAESKDTSPDFEAIQESSEDIDDENEKLYLVTKISKNSNNETVSEEIFLTLTDSVIKEKDSNRGRVINKWSLDSLESCVKLQDNKLNLSFDTVKRDKRERIYEMEEAEAHALFKILTEKLESRTLQDMNQIVYKCVSCLSHFSKIINRRKPESNSRCPMCYSKLIIQVDDQSEIEKSGEKKLGQSSKSDTRASQNRGSSTGLMQGLANQAPEQVVKCSSQSSIGSAASLDELNEHSNVQSSSGKRSDSDVEILSNPSQSSIEVLDGPSSSKGGCTPRRKRSSEERQVEFKLPDSAANIGNSGLTESCSSGSATDSVCTAYENSATPSGSKSDAGAVGGAAAAAAAAAAAEGGETSTKVTKFPALAEDDEVVDEIPRIRDRSRSRLNTSEEIQYYYTDYTKIDHRIKLFLYSHVFDDTSEEFRFGIRCTVLLFNSVHSLQAYIAFSNKKFYILKIIANEEGDDASKFLKKSNSLKRHLKVLKSITLLAWHQGLLVKLEDTHNKLKEFLIILRDVRRTDTLLRYFQTREVRLPATCSIISEYSEKPNLIMQHFLVTGTSEDSNIQFFSMLRSCSIIRFSDVKQVESAALMVTDTDFVIFSSEPFWFFEGNDKPLRTYTIQKLNNLMGAEAEKCKIYLQFINGTEKREEIWEVTMETEEGIQDLTNAVKTPWEKIFAIPFHVTSV